MMGLVEGIQFKDNFNSIIYSCKKSIPHQFDEFKLVFDDRDYVNGEVIAHYTDIAVVKLSYKNVTVQAYIYKSKVSACAFINNEDIPIYLPKGSSFKFVIQRMDEKNSIVEVSRKPYRQELDDVEIG